MSLFSFSEENNGNKREFIIKCKNEEDFNKVQKKLFSMGYKWADGTKEVKDFMTNAISTLAEDNYEIKQGPSEMYNMACSTEILSAKDFLDSSSSHKASTSQSSSSEGISLDDVLDEIAGSGGSEFAKSIKTFKKAMNKLETDDTFRRVCKSAAQTMTENLGLNSQYEKEAMFMFAAAILLWEEEK